MADATITHSPLNLALPSVGRAPSRPSSPEEDVVPEWYAHCCGDLSKRRAAPTRIGAMHATLANAARLWDTGSTLTYSFVRPAGTKTQQEKVKTVVKEWENYANIKFKFTTARTATIRISFDPTDGSWSYLGKDILGIPKNQATMNYGWVSEGKTITEDDKGVILHEFGHTLGYQHEHQNSRRDDKLTLDKRAVIDFYMRTQGWSEATVRQQILDVYNDQEVSNFSEIDLTSIMMYFMPAAMNLERIEVPPNNELSSLDKAFAFLNYPFPRAQLSSTATAVSVESAIAVIGIQDEYKTEILSEYDEGDWEGVRAEFTRWSLSERAKAVTAKIKAEREMGRDTVVSGNIPITN